MRTLISIVFLLTVISFFAGEVFAASHPFFEISQSEKRVLAENAESIQVGDSYSKVISTLGEPTYENELVRKENSEVYGKSLSYYAVIWEENLVNEIHDEYVTVYLDNEQKVSSVYIRLKAE